MTALNIELHLDEIGEIGLVIHNLVTDIKEHTQIVQNMLDSNDAPNCISKWSIEEIETEAHKVVEMKRKLYNQISKLNSYE